MGMTFRVQRYCFGIGLAIVHLTRPDSGVQCITGGSGKPAHPNGTALHGRRSLGPWVQISSATWSAIAALTNLCSVRANRLVYSDLQGQTPMLRPSRSDLYFAAQS